MLNTRTLYRPVGEKEMILIANSGFQKFPPRLEWQPIFYPVLNEQYAIEIASKWNTNDEFGNYLGFVTAFDIDNSTFQKYEIRNVGGKHHNELWVPAENLDAFNKTIIGKIRVTRVFKGSLFENAKSEQTAKIIEVLEHKASINKK